MNTKAEYEELRDEIRAMPDKEFFGCNLYPLTDYADMLESENTELRKQIERARSESLDIYERVLKGAYRKIEELEVIVWHYEVIALSPHINKLCNTFGWYEYYNMVEIAKDAVGWKW